MRHRETKLTASDLLKPRKNLLWKQSSLPKPCWSRPFLIENRITRSFDDRMIFEENAARNLLRGEVEGELARLSASGRRFWLAEYRFLEKMMTLSQLLAYAPAFVRLSRIMPRKLVFCRRMVVRKYLKQHLPSPNRLISKLCNRFVRSSVLLYPAEKLVSASDKFVALAARSADQSVAANRERVIMLLRSLHMMTDQEICEQFQRERDYLNELHLLVELVRFYQVDINDVFSLSAADIAHFWKHNGA
ncbi:hypothetical protein [Sneathiella sp.]|uniref:hypothetical protein n=1 Tax=Sneathiella sp. TaxID=1964365 RepID=UPI0035681032